ncbi:MAG TPA: Rrf2 family transcriptional regulator [Candidatus Limnocylindrales bacterium]|nr:Rrf2 family transcriptional regulator [Candidatus Limnocylindrales bacterium]
MRLELTRRGDYAVRAMLALGQHSGDDWLSVPAVSAAMAIPERFLPRIMADLVEAGLVQGRRGRTGGYRLARPADVISLLDIIAAAEREPDPRKCILRGGPCRLDGRCAVHDAFTGAREAMLDRLGATTLAEVARAGLA